MDISAIIVVLVLTALSFGAIVWLEIYSRRTQPKESASDQTGSGIKRNYPPSGPVSRNGAKRV
jgi:hypothetical protein